MKILLIVICLASILLFGCGNSEEGEKVGTIIKISNEGLFNKTCEVMMIRGGMVDGSGSFGAPFEFTIENPELIKKAKVLMISKKEIKLTYHVERVCSPFRSEHKDHGMACCFADNIE